MSISRQIIGSFEDIGKEIASETAKVPGDIAGKALESLGASSGAKKTASGTNVASQTAGGAVQENSVIQQMEQTNDQKVKQHMARSALAQFASPHSVQEPSVWDQKVREEAELKNMKAQQEKKAGMAALPTMTSKRKRGNLYGVKQKASSEMSKNVRQD